jgi:serine protease AprX
MIPTADRRRPLAATVAILAAALSWMVALPATGSPTGPTSVPAIVDPALRAAHGTVGVIIQGASSVESTVRQMGGRVTHDLPLIGGFSARVPAGDVRLIAHLPGATSITLDRPTHVQASTPGTYNNVPSVYRKSTSGDRLNAAGGRGQGVTVALIDTGVTSLPDIAHAMVPVIGPAGPAPCVNFTTEPTCDDSYGHGTFMAGIIAGNGAASNGKYVGMASAAGVLSLKIAGASGASDVSTIIAAIQWVVTAQPTYNIRVLNLSLGTDSTQSYRVDPLDYAVEKAWQAGIVVDVAASNRGPAPYTISDPANDPFVITVGAVDDRGTNGINDDLLPNFSGRGPTATDNLAKPDVVAPGAHIVSLAAPGSSITTQFPSTMAAPYRRGSGTSMANAVVSGLVAQLVSLQPTLTPDRVKYMLTSTARQAASTDVMSVGHGEVDGWGALSAVPGLANVGVTPSLGTGSLAASRGTTGVVLDDANQTVLDASSGDLTAALTSVDTSGGNWFGGNWFGGNWFGGNWFGGNWFGGNWFGGNWFGGNWFGGNWFGGNWFGGNWFGVENNTEDYGGNWFGSAWYGAWDQ